MKKVLAIYYTQSGQLKDILDSTLKPLLNSSDIKIDYLKLEPVKDFPFPWGKEFYNCFPETVLGIPCEMKPFNIDINVKYDVIVLAHQPWYLSPSIPIWSFLESNQAKKLLDGKKIITLIGARNMWAGAQEIIKRKLHDINASLIGNIVLQDRTDNVIAAYTIIKWLIHGKKRSSRFLPEAGVSKKDIANSDRFGKIILDSIQNEQYKNLQKNLLKSNAVRVKYHLLNMEINARKIFCKFASLAIKQEKRGEKFRELAIRFFKVYLIFALFIISPFVSLLFMIIRILIFPIANNTLNYYKGIALK